MKKIIFLDIDGVLNSDEFYYNTQGKEGDIDEDCINLLNKLYSKETFIVISSSWGEDAYKLLDDAGCKIPIIGCTPHFNNKCICRGNEILAWLLDNNYEISTFNGESYNNDVRYVIIDDDTDMLLSQKDFFVQTDRQCGLTSEDIEKCKTILNYVNNR